MCLLHCVTVVAGVVLGSEGAEASPRDGLAAALAANQQTARPGQESAGLDGAGGESTGKARLVFLSRHTRLRPQTGWLVGRPAEREVGGPHQSASLRAPGRREELSGEHAPWAGRAVTWIG
jgi:hypothetical protein